MWQRKRLKSSRIFVIVGFLSIKPDDVLITVLVKANHGKSPDIKNMLKLDKLDEPDNFEPIISVKTIRYTAIITIGLINAHTTPRIEPAYRSLKSCKVKFIINGIFIFV